MYGSACGTVLRGAVLSVRALAGSWSGMEAAESEGRNGKACGTHNHSCSPPFTIRATRHVAKDVATSAAHLVQGVHLALLPRKARARVLNEPQPQLDARGACRRRDPLLAPPRRLKRACACMGVRVREILWRQVRERLISGTAMQALLCVVFM